MYKELNEYLKSVDGVSHITLDPNGPGVVRIHLIPPKKVKLGVLWVVIINGQDILPLTTGWAILLREFINVATSYEGKSLSDENINDIIDEAVDNTAKVFPKTKKSMLKSDLRDIITTFVDIAKNKIPSSNVGYMTLSKYAKYMKAPHRMDLMVSSMYKNGLWHCNNKCLHCYAGNQKEATVKELDTASWKIIIDKCRNACIPQLTFTGGEPTLRSDLPELIKYASWFVTRLNTNGILLTRQLCKELVDASLDSVQVTLYSSREEIHNMLVGSSTFKKTVEGIKNALAAGLNVSINTPLCKLNADYIETIKFAENLGIRYFTCSGLIMTGNSLTNEAKDTYLSKNELLEIITEANKYCKDVCNSKEYDLEMNFTSPGWLNEDSLKALGLTVPSCGACLSNMAVAPNGDVIPCQSWLNSDSLGNLLNESFTKIWSSRACKKIRKNSSKMEGYCQLSTLDKGEK